MTILRKLTAVATAGALGYFGYRSLSYLQNEEIEDLLSEANRIPLQKAIADSRQILTDLQKKNSIPGLTVAVSVNGNLIWREGFGYKDLENKSLCSPKTVMKIASISKCITSVILAKEIELGRLDLDEDISHYVTEWPTKYWKKEKVKITPRLLACHLGGIRGYRPIEDNKIPPAFRFAEYAITERFRTMKDALKLFQNDPLVGKPGEEFIYSNHGYTLLSAALESTSKKRFQDLLNDAFRKFGMRNSFIDDPHRIVYDRSRQYSTVDGKIINAPYVESSFKIAAAGLLSSSVDLVRFANVLLHSYFYDSMTHEDESTSKDSDNQSERYLKKETLDLLWTPVEGTSISWHEDGKYGLGWQIVEVKDHQKVYLGHTGRSIGTSSVLLIALPGSGSVESKGLGLLKKSLQPFTSSVDPLILLMLCIFI